MADADRCPNCGSELPLNAPRGLCPRCLHRQGLDSDAFGLVPGVSPATTMAPDSGWDGSSVLASLAESVGPVPRVLLRDSEPATDPGPFVKPGSPEMPPSPDPAGLQLLGEIARGGMGAVLKGRDPDLGRDLAVKVLLEQHRDNPKLIRRFLEEAQIAGQLQHPGVVPVYELGAFADRRPYFTMKLVKGLTLADLLDARPDPAADQSRVLGIFLQICQTVAYAHARGVIHRDLKPTNVMVGSFGEVQVMDWGLAKVLPRGGVVDDAQAGKLDRQETVIATDRSGSGEPGLSRAGSVMGTPSFMAPGAGARRGRAGGRARRRLRAGLDPLRDPHRRSGLSWPLLRRDPPQGGAGRPGQRDGPPGHLRGRRRADRHREGLPGARGGGPPAACRRRGRAGHGLSRRRAGSPPRRRDRPRRRGRPRRGGHPHRRRGQRARAGRAPRPAVPGGAGGLAAGADHHGRAHLHLPAPAAPAARRAAGPGARRGHGVARPGAARGRRCRARGATPWRRWSAPRARGRRSRSCATRSGPG